MARADAKRLLQFVAVVALSGALAGCAGSGGSRSSGAPNEPSPNEQSAALQVKLGQGYLNQGELETARDKLQRALELDPKSVDAHTVMAVLNERIGRSEIAERHYRRAVELKPDGGAVNNNYGSFLCGSGRNAEAQTYFKVAVADPFYRTPAVAYANAGFCAASAGDHEMAERALRSSLELEPRNPDVLFELAKLSLLRGDAMRARAFLQRFESVAGVAPEALALGAEVESRLGDAGAAQRYRERLQQNYPDFTPATSSPGAGSE